MASLEVARRCPKCEQPGEEGGTKHLRSKDRLITYFCRNDGCKWFNTSYVIQVRPDGTVPEPDTRPRPKDYPERSAGGLEIRHSMEALERELAASKEGAEIRRRR